MKKITMFAFAALVCASVAMAQTYTSGTGITGIDKLGAHQNGGRGCVGCHAPHSGVRGNGGTLTSASVLTSTPNTHNATGNQFSWSNQPAITGDVGDETLWGQDIGPVMALTITTGNGYQVDLSLATTKERIKTGIVYCLSCHDGNVAKGAMMTNQSFEQSAGLLPSSYGSQPIPTLLGADGGTAGNYANDHPIGPNATVSALGATSVARYVDLDSTTAPTVLILKASQPDNKYTTFQSNYGLPTVVGARAGAGFVVETGMANAGAAYVVCTTCHTPHSMYTASAGSTNPIAGLTSGTFPSYFFIAAPYNPGANTANGTKASSATQFCRQCHFTGAGGANEGSSIMTIPTAF
ncbi:MAG TPA: hypothetical protein VMG30_21355 [Acidobacteriota bacterium]|nr:hypothetical protein [Acidobacteriota bacterium]